MFQKDLLSMNNFVSLCLLAYKRPQQLKECIESIKQTADYPYELIVNVDGGDTYATDYCSQLLVNREISKVILSGGNNRGVGKAFENCLGVAEGEIIFKVDTDLTFKANWLSKTLQVLKNNPDIGAVSIFDYHNYDPKDTRFIPEFNHLEKHPDYIIVKDFVSSIYGFRRDDLKEAIARCSGIVPDDGLHQSFGGRMAITSIDLAVNHGFGASKSTYISGTDEAPYKTPTFDKPLIFLSGLDTLK